MPTPPLLTVVQIEKQQAEAEGYQQGPTPFINNQNANTQDNLGNPIIQSAAPALLVPPPYYPGATETPNMNLSLTNMGVNIAENFCLIDTLSVTIPVLGIANFTGLTAGQSFSFQPISSGIFNIMIVATAVAPIVFSQAQVNFDLTYTDNAGAEYNDAVVALLDNLQAASINNAVFALVSAPIVIVSSYVTFGVAGALPTNVWNQPVTVGGAGTAAYGATIHQAVSGATAFYYASNVTLGGVPNFMIYTVLTGVDNGTNTWTDLVSGQTFTPISAGAETAGTFTGPGFGVNMIQFVSGAFGLEMVIPTAPKMYLGPHVSGTPDLPSGHIAIPGPVPSTTHNYAWYDPVNGGVFVPTAPWTDAATRVVFPYNEHIRILQIG